MMTSPIDHLGVLAIRGADAVPFSHSQLANDVKALPSGHWQWNTLLQIQGRVLALMLVARRADDDLLLVLPREIRGDVRSTLAHYVLRSKVRIEEDDTLQVAGRWSRHDCTGGGSPSSGGPLRIDTDGIALPLGGGYGRTLAIIAAGTSSGVSIGNAWREADIDDGIPWVRIGTVGQFTPQALGLARLSAYSVSKGCYPGQEIVARTHYLGKAKRQAWWLEGIGLGAGQTIEDLEGKAVGDVVEATADGHGALAVAALDGPGAVRCGTGGCVARVPWRGLAR